MDLNDEFRKAVVVIDQFRTTYGSLNPRLKEDQQVSNKMICVQYGLTENTFSKRLANALGSHRDLKLKFIRVAEDIRRDANGVAKRLNPRVVLPSPVKEADAHDLLRQSRSLAASDEIAAAVALARMGLRRALTDFPQDLPIILPQVLYIFLRHASTRQFLHMIRHEVLPTKDALCKAKLPPGDAAAALGQLACALNEGGAFGHATEIFRSGAVRRLAQSDGYLEWCGPMIIRNEAHALVWNDHALAHARDRARDAGERSTHATNQHSVANTLCELSFHCQQYQHAWSAIEPYYRSIRGQLLDQYDGGTRDLTGPAIPRFQSSFGSLYSAVLVRLSMRNSGYTTREQSEDIALLEAMLQVDDRGHPSRRMFHGGIVEAPVRALRTPIAPKLQRLSALTLKPRLNDREVEDIMACVGVLRQAGGV